LDAERQIAFYGGNFTGIEYDYQRELLNTAQEFVEAGIIDSIRISTRPDYIDEETVSLLQEYSVRNVEIGSQSMVDSVLARCGREHTAADTVRAIENLKSSGFQTGIHLMAGLPGDDRHGFDYTIDRVIALKPDTVRIHPTIVFADTGLADLYHAGDYIPLDLETAVDYCCHALTQFRQAGIDVIRMGLQATAQMEEPGAIVAGPFHPAFRSLVEGSIFLKMAESMLEFLDGKRGDSFEFRVSERDLSDFRGIRNRNMNHLKERFGESISVYPDPCLVRGEIVLESGDRRIVKKRN
jgi:histone acetyltransferase (RNA polymerase elongator complex component)